MEKDIMKIIKNCKRRKSKKIKSSGGSKYIKTSEPLEICANDGLIIKQVAIF